MCSVMVWLGLAVSGIVDRIEGPMVVIEWREGAFSDVPLSLLPGVEEGDRICLSRRPPS